MPKNLWLCTNRCIETLFKAAEYEEIEKNKLLLLLNTRQAEANKRTVLANLLKDKAQREPSQAANYLREAANHHLESAKLRGEAASIARETGDDASCYNLLGSAYQDKAFYHSYLALEAQTTDNPKKVVEEHRKAVEFLESALEHYELSLSASVNEETENNRAQCLKYLEDFRADLQEAEKNSRKLFH